MGEPEEERMERLKSYISDLARQDEHLGSLAHDLMREVKQDPKNEQAKHTAVLLHTTRKQLQNWKRQCALARSDPEQYVPVPVEKKLEWSREIVRDDIPEGGVEIMLQQMGDGKAWWDRESGYFKLDLGLGKDDSEERVIQMANKGNNWRGVFQLPEFGTGKKVSRQLQNRIKRARFTFEIWRPRTISFVMGHRPIGHCTRGVKMEGLLTRTEVKDTILVSAAADDKKNTMTFSIRFRVRTPLSEREFETVRETYLAFPVPFPPSLKTYTAVNIPVPDRPLPEEDSAPSFSPSSRATATGASTRTVASTRKGTSASPADARSSQDRNTMQESQSHSADQPPVSSPAGGSADPPSSADQEPEEPADEEDEEEGPAATPLTDLGPHPFNLQFPIVQDFEEVKTTLLPLSHEWTNTVESIDSTLTLADSAGGLAATLPGGGLSDKSELEFKKTVLIAAIQEGAVDFEAYINQMKADLALDTKMALFYKKENRLGECKLFLLRCKEMKSKLAEIEAGAEEE